MKRIILMVALLLPVLSWADPATENGIQSIKSEIEVSNVLLAQIETNTARGASSGPVLPASCDESLLASTQKIEFAGSGVITSNRFHPLHKLMAMSKPTSTVLRLSFIETPNFIRNLDYLFFLVADRDVCFVDLASVLTQ